MIGHTTQYNIICATETDVAKFGEAYLFNIDIQLNKLTNTRTNP